jgi:toxin ParE1/3/4
MPHKLVLTPRAKEDILDIWSYIALDSVRAADAVLDRFETLFGMLTHTPEAGIDRSDLLAGLRSFPDGRYLIFYRHIAGTTDIVRVIAAARRITSDTFRD